MATSRPESIEDLASYERSQTLASIALLDKACKGGILELADQLVDGYVEAYGDEQVRVEVSGPVLEIVRPLSDDELAALLKKRQDSWDRHSSPRPRAVPG